MTKVLLTKRKNIDDDEDDQDIVIETLRNTQDLVEHWIQQKLVVGVKDDHEENMLIQDACACYQWLSEPKVTVTRVLRVEIFFTIK